MKSPKDHWIIQIEITNTCVHTCSNCTRFCGHHKKPFFMDFQTFKRAVDSLEGRTGMIGIMGGEPTLHPEFERFSEYLISRMPKKNRANNYEFIYPQKQFMKARLLNETSKFFLYNYSTGPRKIICGAGLWSSMNLSYKKHFEFIQDCFPYQAINDHVTEQYHQPILVTRKELGISDEKFKELRDNCWIQQRWSSSITPKGAFFCEVAASLDMLLDGPGGWPIEKGWWRREENDFGDQVQWCELCGIALNDYTFSRDAREGIDDVSPVWAEKLKVLNTPKLSKGLVNNLVIKNGSIIEECKAHGEPFDNTSGVPYVKNLEDRFTKDKSILFPGGFECVYILEQNQSNKDEVGENGPEIFDRYFTIDVSQGFGQAFNRILRDADPDKYLVVLSGDVLLNGEGFNELKNCVINPGTLHYINFTEEHGPCGKFFAGSHNGKTGYVALLHKNALSLRRAGFDRIAAMRNFQEVVNIWEQSKIVPFTDSMIYDPCPLPLRFPERRFLKSKQYVGKFFYYCKEKGLAWTLKTCLNKMFR